MSKYIDVETLKVVLESRIEAGLDGYGGNLKWLLESIDTLQQEQPDFAEASKMEQPSVEDAMKELNEKIALVKESGTWDGVDVDKYMDDVRGREPMPDSTKLIELWHKCKEILQEKDFRGDPWRLAYNAFMDGFARGVAIKKEKSKKEEQI